MCGIVGAVSYRDIVKVLLEGLHRLEYRGYDSAGLMIVNNEGYTQRLRCVGKVDVLSKSVDFYQLYGCSGIAHTRWATHGKPTELNAHPHMSGHIVVVHNGIVENYKTLRKLLKKRGYFFTSDTDTEVIAHLIHWEQHKKNGSLVEVMLKVVKQLQGSYSIVVMDSDDPSTLVGIRFGGTLVIGCGIGENFFASDPLALFPITKKFIFLEESDIAEITCCTIRILNNYGNHVKRTEVYFQVQYDFSEKGCYRHYMRKEIFEQPKAIQNTLEKRISKNKIILSEFGHEEISLLKNIQHIKIVACGSSYHSAIVSKYWFESFAKISCDVEIASEFRYRQSVILPGTLFITISQSGETADTLAALKKIKKTSGYLGSLAICNVSHSSLSRESDLTLMTDAGPEIGVAATKTFTTQLTIILMLAIYMGNILKKIDINTERLIINALKILPECIDKMLSLEKNIEIIAKDFFDTQNALFLGRGILYPIAMEGALKLKEISYIHAEAYAAGELKHGPLALIDTKIPVIIIASNNFLLEKLKSNIEEIRSRGGKLYIFAEQNTNFITRENTKIVFLPHVEDIVTPISYVVSMQLLAYHVALIKGTDVDQPRNLAKSVTVE